VIALAGVALLLMHPFGEPQTVRLSAEGDVVTVRWTAPSDDLLAVGGAVGALPDRRELVFDLAPDGTPEPVGQTDAERLVTSIAFADYLAEHVSVRQGGDPCPVDVRLDELVEDGAELRFRCPGVVGEVEVEVTTLTDLHDAYRTVALGDGTSPARSLYTAGEASHTWTFGEAADRGQAVDVGVWWFIAGLLGLGGAAFAMRTYTHRHARGRRGADGE
jgi:hypothetical protein